MAPTDASKFGDLKVRVISAIVVGFGSLLLVWLGGFWMAALITVAAVAMTVELRIITRRGEAPDVWSFVFAAASAGGVLAAAIWGAEVAFLALGLGVLAAAAIQPSGPLQKGPSLARLAFTAIPAIILALGVWWQSTPVMFAGGVALIALTYVLHTGDDDPGPMITILGTFYIGTATIAFVLLREVDPFGFLSILWAALVVVAADIGGYFAGRIIGGPKLWPAVSPKKTWAGLGGGVVLAFLVGGIFSWATTGTYFYQVCIVSMIAAGVSQAGDLAESALKRRFAVKDASGLIPGHGGVLDRLDGHMAAVLVAAAVTFARDQPVFVW